MSTLLHYQKVSTRHCIHYGRTKGKACFKGLKKQPESSTKARDWPCNEEKEQNPNERKDNLIHGVFLNALNTVDTEKGDAMMMKVLHCKKTARLR